MSGEVGQSMSEQAQQEYQEAQAEGSTSSTGGASGIPAITVTEASEEGVRVSEVEDEMPPPQLAGTTLREGLQ